MRRQHAGRDRRLVGNRGHRQRASEHALDLFARQTAGPQQCRFVQAGDDGGLDADRAGAAIDHHVDAPAQIGQHVRRAGRRDVAGAVGRGRHHRPVEGREQRVRDWMRRHPHRHAVEAGEREIGHAAIGLFRQHQRQRSGPERAGKLLGGGIEAPEPARGVHAGDMGDQRIEARPALGGVEPGDGLAIAGVGAEPIDGLGRERDQPAGGKAGGRRRDRRRDLVALGLQHPRSRFGSHRTLKLAALREPGL